ncbi:hypothetical protein BW733_02800 [Tessaracoccus flavescens]|uniref:ABC transporter domain-containing protein n=1 Tax=Tessaracoccus flavescens TaxID=399497 RepID=A0A1Q2CUZ4_9ACTN|nr:hypothetical protein BW733_02800 [Tessaracoccus flavescens]
MVAISRSMVTNAKVLILDEPTSSLDSAEVEQLFTVMRRLRDEGVAILFAARLRRRPARDRVGRTRGHRRRRQDARRGAEAPHRLLLREQARRGHHPRPERAREHHSRCPGQAWLGAPAAT